MNADNEKKAELEMNISATTSGMQEVQKFPSITSGKVNGWRKANLNPFFTNLKLILSLQYPANLQPSSATFSAAI